MRYSVLSGAAALAAVLMTFPVGAQDGSPKASHPCKRVVNCDCESIDAGLLTGGWKTDCRACQKGIHQKCMEAYANGVPLYRAMVAGGYCENACSVTGDNPKPRAPETGGGSAPAEVSHRPAKMKLRCGLDEEWTVEEEDKTVTSGCTRNGKRDGLWLIENTGTGEITEILYENGEEVWRKTRKAEDEPAGE